MFLVTVAKPLLAKPLQILTRLAQLSYSCPSLAVAAISVLLMLYPSCSRYTGSYSKLATVHLQRSLSASRMLHIHYRLQSTAPIHL